MSKSSLTAEEIKKIDEEIDELVKHAGNDMTGWEYATEDMEYIQFV